MDGGCVRRLGSPVGGLMVKISVVMPVYNPPLEMLERAVESILAQTFRDFEFLILDDGSRHGRTRGYLESLTALDARVRVFHEPHRGLTATLNLGLRLACGEFIARQDADDWSEPQRLARQVAYFGEHPDIGLVGTDAYLHRADGGPLWRLRLPHTPAEVGRAFSGGNPLVHGATMFRTQLALAIGGYREEFTCAQDYDFFRRLFEAGGGVNLDEALYHYRYAPGAVSAQRATDQARMQRAARMLAEARQRGDREDVPAAIRTANGASDGGFQAALQQADHVMLAGNFWDAGKAYLRLLRSNPARGLAWAKMFRFAVFAAVPPVREALFR